MTATTYDGAIAERPRRVSQYPLLDAIYERHDQVIAEHVTGRTLEVACGQHVHAAADEAVDIDPRNAPPASAIADARRLPYRDGAFSTVIGRRFIHHVPSEQRRSLLEECRRVLGPDGLLCVIEGTPGRYRRLTKAVGFGIGVLGDDTDEYGHLWVDELRSLLTDAGFAPQIERSLGSILMPFAILQHESVRGLERWLSATQCVRWWTFAVARPVGGGS